MNKDADFFPILNGKRAYLHQSKLMLTSQMPRKQHAMLGKPMGFATFHKSNYATLNDWLEPKLTKAEPLARCIGRLMVDHLEILFGDRRTTKQFSIQTRRINPF